MPKWIGTKYSQLWTEFKDNTFYFNDARDKLGKYTLNYLSELYKSQSLFLFERESRKRIYRLVPPNIYIYSFAHGIDLNWLKQGVYANLILTIFTCLKEEFNQDLLSLGVYGSIARNTADNQSDLDLFLLFRELPDNISERLRMLRKIEEKKLIQDELRYLNKKSYYPQISCYACKESELKLSFFTIDIAFDIKILYDTNVLADFLQIINKKIKERGIRRKYLDKERYYLDLNIKFGEVFEF